MRQSSSWRSPTALSCPEAAGFSSSKQHPWKWQSCARCSSTVPTTLHLFSSRPEQCLELSPRWGTALPFSLPFLNITFPLHLLPTQSTKVTKQKARFSLAPSWLQSIFFFSKHYTASKLSESSPLKTRYFRCRCKMKFMSWILMPLCSPPPNFTSVGFKSAAYKMLLTWLYCTEEPFSAWPRVSDSCIV